MFCCSSEGPGIGLGTVAQNIPLWLTELWTREWFSLSPPASANFSLWTWQQCYCKTQHFTFIIAQGRGYLWQFLGPLQPLEFWIELFICQSSPWARLRLCLNLFWRLSCSVNQVSHRSKAYFSPSCCNALMCILWLPFTARLLVFFKCCLRELAREQHKQSITLGCGEDQRQTQTFLPIFCVIIEMRSMPPCPVDASDGPSTK